MFIYVVVSLLSLAVMTWYILGYKKFKEETEDDLWGLTVKRDLYVKQIEELKVLVYEIHESLSKQQAETVLTETDTVIKKVKPSLRNPMKTYDAFYENYKGRQSNLYQPVKPKRNGTSEVDN